jgi:diguanylate cyclase (GGDEF)-like protein
MDVPALELPPPRILVVEDEPAIARLLHAMLEAEGYATQVAYTGEDGIDSALREVPELIILDLMLPGMDGFEVVKRLRTNARTAHIPVVVLSARHDTNDKVRALNSQANDYLTKPFNSDELMARIRTQLRHVRESLLSPLTGLPSGLRIEHAIAQTLGSNVQWAILYLDLDHFKAYNDVYGPLQGNDLIRLLGRVSTESVRETGNTDDFVGHIGGDDFIVITTPDRVQSMCQRIVSQWDRESLAYYSPEDVQRGTLLAQDRQGHLQAYPLAGVSIGVVTNLHRPIVTMEAFSRTAAEAKARAKTISGSGYFIDQRGSGASVAVPDSNSSPATFS